MHRATDETAGPQADELARRVRELEEANALLRQSEQRLAAELVAAQRLQQVSAHLLQADDIGVLYAQILDTALSLLHADFASIQLLHPGRGEIGELQMLDSRGFPPEAAQFWAWVRPDSKSACGEALRTQRRVTVPDVEQAAFMADSDDLAIFRQVGIRAVQTTPLFGRTDALLGMFSTLWREPHPLTLSEQHTLDALARQAADLIERKRAEEALRASEERLQSAISIETVGVIFLNLEGLITDANAAFQRMSGYSRAEFQNHRVRWDVMTPPEFMPATHAARDELARTGQATPYEKQYIRKDGSRFWGLFAPKLIRADEAVEFIIDITEKKRTEAALQAGEARQAFLLDVSDRLRPLSNPTEIMAVASAELARWLDVATVGYCEVEPDGTTGIVRGGYGDGRMPDLVGRLLVGERHGGWLTEMQRGEDALYADLTRDPRAQLLGIAAGAGTPLIKDGRLTGFLFAVHVEPRTWTQEDRQIMHEVAERTWAAVERARAEAALRTREAQMRLLLESVQDYAIFTLDPEGHVTSWNEGARRLKGYTAEEIIGRSVHEFYTPEDVAAGKPERAMETALARGRSEDESWRVRKDGTRFWANEIMTPLRSDTGLLLGFTKVSRDLSERRQTEERLEVQVKERTAQVRSLVTQVTLSEQAERRRVSRILHDDLQQRLFSLIYQLTAVRQSLDDGASEATRQLLEVERALRDAVRITRELSVDLSPPVLHNEGLVEAMRWLAAQMEQQQGLEVDVQVRGATAALNEDLRVLLFQTVRELLFNVVKHTEAAAAQVVLTYGDGQLRIEVSDAGQGFLPQEEGSRGRNSRGLPRMGQRLQLLGGHMTVNSTPGQGTRITLDIPLQGRERNPG